VVAGLLITPPLFPTNNPVPVFPYIPVLLKPPVDRIELQLLPGPPIILPELLLVIPFAVTDPTTITVPLFCNDPVIVVVPPRVKVAPLFTVIDAAVKLPVFTKFTPVLMVRFPRLIVPVGPFVKLTPELKFKLLVLENVPLFIIVQFPL
jgi:hypothetical protein